MSNLRLGQLVKEVVGRPGTCAEGDRSPNEATGDDERNEFHESSFWVMAAVLVGSVTVSRYWLAILSR